MKYLPILVELFSSDSIFFLIIGLVLAAFVGVRMTDLLLLFVGTIALGCLIGFGISLLVSEERTKK